MPTPASDAIRLHHGTVAELYQVLSVLLETEHNGTAPVQTEVGLSGGDVFVGGKAMSVRVEFGGRVIISADEVR